MCDVRILPSTIAGVEDEHLQRGLFAINPYQTGDVIIDNSQPIMSSITVTDEKHNMVLVTQLTPPAVSFLSGNDGSLPENVQTHQVGKFRGMIQSILSYALHRSSHEESTPSNTTKLLELYHPTSTSTSTSTFPSNHETEIVALSQTATSYLRRYAQPESSLSKLLEGDDDVDVEFVSKLCLIYSCNAFEGGCIYDAQISRINHSCDPNATTHTSNTADSSSNSMTIRATSPIAAGEEITISYLGILLYADTTVRRSQLLQTKHFVCGCDRCRNRHRPDVSGCIPCPSCHARVEGKYLEEDVMWDDEENNTGAIQYAHPRITTRKNGTESVTFDCPKCGAEANDNADFPANDDSKLLNTLVKTVSAKIANRLLEVHTDEKRVKGGTGKKPTDIGKDVAIDTELDEQLYEMSMSICGSKHWSSNILLLTLLTRQISKMNARLLLSRLPTLETLGEAIDSLQRLYRFIESLQLKADSNGGGNGDGCGGKLLVDATLNVARILVAMGDEKSVTYARYWIQKINRHVTLFESVETQTVCRAVMGSKRETATLTASIMSEGAGVSKQLEGADAMMSLSSGNSNDNGNVNVEEEIEEENGEAFVVDEDMMSPSKKKRT